MWDSLSGKGQSQSLLKKGWVIFFGFLESSALLFVINWIVVRSFAFKTLKAAIVKWKKTT